MRTVFTPRRRGFPNIPWMRRSVFPFRQPEKALRPESPDFGLWTLLFFPYITFMKLELPEYNYCPICGSPVQVTQREGRRRPVCTRCGHIIYVNPYPAACLVVIKDSKVLLTRRSIEPHFGEWCLPGGFLE